jgi:hypothetical protein
MTNSLLIVRTSTTGSGRVRLPGEAPPEAPPEPGLSGSPRLRCHPPRNACSCLSVFDHEG